MSHLQRAKEAEERYQKERKQGYRRSSRESSLPLEKLDYGETVDAAVRQLEEEILTGQISPAPLLINGEPLGLLLPLDEVARLLRLGAKRRAG